MPKTSYELELASNEHIDFMQYMYNKEGIHEVVFKTNLGRMLMMDEEESESVECLQIDFNLADMGECLIGFKGQFDNYITNLSFYKAARLGAKPPQKKAKQ